MRRLSVLFFIYVFLTACSGNKSKGIIPKDEMVQILTDLHLADGYTMSSVTSGNIPYISSVYTTIYKKYETDSITVRRSLEYYTRQPDELAKMYEEVDKKISVLQKAEEKRLTRERLALERKLNREEAIRQAKEKAALDRSNMQKGLHDFNLPIYKSPAEDFLKLWKYPAKQKTNSTKTDSSKTDLLKKEQLKNDIPAKRFRQTRIQ